MAVKKETAFRARIRPKLEALPNTVVMSLQQVALRGDPDLILCCNGRFVALELKRDEKAKVAALQTYKLGKINTQGKGIAFVVYPENWESVYDVLLKVAKGDYEFQTDEQTA